jgi:UbiD family decarboxylase
MSVEGSKGLPLALVIGMHPAFYLAASAEGLDGTLERVRPLGRIGALLGEPLEVVRALTSDLPIPAHGEIVLEGVVAGRERVKTPASPIGYEGGVREVPRMEVRAVSRRADAIFQTAGLFGELPFLPTPIWEAEALGPLRAMVPAVRSLRLPATGLGYHAYVQVEQRRMGEAKKAALAVLSLLPRVKTAIAVDADIEPENDREVLWALATRVVADRDVFMVPGVAGPPEDPTAYEITRRGRGGLVTKLGIDAATPLGLPYDLPEPTRVPGTEGIRLEEYLEDW